MTSTLGLYIALALVAEAGLGVLATSSNHLSLKITAAIGMVLVLVLMVYFSGTNWEQVKTHTVRGPMLGDPFAGLDHLPLEVGHKDSIKGEWYGEWKCRAKDGSITPYTDDTIHVREIDLETGHMEAWSQSVYSTAVVYTIRGRISRKGFGLLYYTTPAPNERLAGIVILRFDYLSETAKGWWLGAGRSHGSDVGGPVKWTKSTRWRGDWADKKYSRASE